MSDHPTLAFITAYAAVAMALSMLQLGAWHPRAPRSIPVVTGLVAAPMAYYLVAPSTHWPLPDPENWTAFGTVVIAMTAVVGVWFGVRTIGALRDQGRQNARQTAALIEQAWPHVSLVTEDLPLLHRDDLGWWGRIRHSFGTTPARDVEIWVRDPIGLYSIDLNLVLPGTTVPFLTALVQGPFAPQSPFPILDGQPDEDTGWVGIAWRCPDNDFRYELVEFTFTAELELQVANPNQRDPGFRRPLSR